MEVQLLDRKTSKIQELCTSKLENENPGHSSQNSILPSSRTGLDLFIPKSYDGRPSHEGKCRNNDQFRDPSRPICGIL